MKPTQIQFLLNDQEISTDQPKGILVLDYLRHAKRLVGTKEGCKEGDCGACMVLIGKLKGKGVEYQPVTSCLVPLGELHGKHLVTVEGLNQQRLTPVQQAIVDEGGSQCGFCTPGIVLSLTGYLMKPGSDLTTEGIKYALGGNLCRCTGYSSLKRAGDLLIKKFRDDSGNGATGNSTTGFDILIRSGVLPNYFKNISARLRKLAKAPAQNSKKTNRLFIAGGTDIYVQQGESLPESNIDVLNLHPEMSGILFKGDKFRIGALTTFEEFADAPDIVRIIPKIKDFMHLNASWQIRNRATLGGNVVNASPIGDMTILLLALESDLVLKNGKRSRLVPMRSFYKGYKDLDKKPSEILTEIYFPAPDSATKIHFEKISKRKTLDIASVNSAIKIRNQGQRITDVQLTMGGVAPIPLILQATSGFLQGRTIEGSTIKRAISMAAEEISPISDIRGSAEYKRLLVRQLIIAHFVTLFPDYIDVSEFYETH